MNILEKFKSIKAFIFDVDGVLTNSQLLITEEGELLRSMNTRDGYALRAAILSGYKVCIITGGSSKGVSLRLSKLGIPDVHAGVLNKLETFDNYVEANNLSPKEILYMGDDLIDYEVMSKVGLSCCPKDAVPEILALADYVAAAKGGEGCAREVIEKVLKLNQKWPGQMLQA